MRFTAPEPILYTGSKSVFLAGTIDMGNSENWQYIIGQQLIALGYDVYDPRRPHWDPSWEQTKANYQFAQQVNWELDALDKADVIIMVLLPDSKSPISLLELGLHAKSGKLIVCCPKEFYRYGNVEIVCERYNIPLCDNQLDLIRLISQRL